MPFGPVGGLVISSMILDTPSGSDCTRATTSLVSAAPSRIIRSCCCCGVSLVIRASTRVTLLRSALAALAVCWFAARAAGRSVGVIVGCSMGWRSARATMRSKMSVGLRNSFPLSLRAQYRRTGSGSDSQYTPSFSSPSVSTSVSHASAASCNLSASCARRNCLACVLIRSAKTFSISACASASARSAAARCLAASCSRNPPRGCPVAGSATVGTVGTAGSWYASRGVGRPAVSMDGRLRGCGWYPRGATPAGPAVKSASGTRSGGGSAGCAVTASGAGNARNRAAPGAIAIVSGGRTSPSSVTLRSPPGAVTLPAIRSSGCSGPASRRISAICCGVSGRTFGPVALAGRSIVSPGMARAPTVCEPGMYVIFGNWSPGNDCCP